MCVLLAAVALIAGCGGAEPSSQAPAGVSVSLAQWRSDEPVHNLQVAVRNIGETPVFFADIQLVTPSFRTLPPKRVETTIGRTNRTDIPIPYGAANCAPDRLPELGPATVVAHVATGGGQPRKVVFAVPHPDPLLTRLLRDECSQYLVERVATIEFGPRWTEAGEVMRTTLVVTRRGAGEVALGDLGGTTHYNVGLERRPLGVLPADRQRMEVPVELTPARCDGHAFGEAKKAFMFPARASLDGGEERVVIVTPPKPVQDRLIRYAQRACGLGGG